MAVLRVMKLGTLAIRTISKPIAARLKTDAGLHPSFANHRFSTMVQRHIYGYSTGLEIRPLNEGRAVEAASNILGELLVFSVQRNSRAEARKEELQRQELEALKKRNEDLTKEVGCLKLNLEEVERLAKGRSFLDMLRSFRFPTQTQQH
ncbi:hypothetical protein CsSME_00026511 [Camellia sinensis var. sinensis]